MEQKNRMTVTLVIAAIIAAAVLSGFFLPFFFGSTPAVVLPDISAPVPSGGSPGGNSNNVQGNYVRVEVTKETVQDVIASLTRPHSYYRELTVETIWGEGEADRSAAEIAVWVDGGFTKTRATLPGGLVQHCLTGDRRIYLWYGGDAAWYETAADELSSDLAQRIPTYEDVLALEKDSISDTDYRLLDGMSCIYVEVREDKLGYHERYWIEVQSGLLVSAETVKDGMVVYRMTSRTMERPIPQDASFDLPDGTVLHEVSKT